MESKMDEVFEKFKMYCRDNMKYNLESLPEIAHEFNVWAELTASKKVQSEEEAISAMVADMDSELEDLDE